MPPLVELRERSNNGVIEDDPRVAPGEFFCKEPGRGVAWLYGDGTLGYVRCGASNRCDYCAMIAACENAVVLRYDSFDGPFPRVGLTTTTAPGRSADYAALRLAEQKLWQQLRRRHGRQVEYCGFVEWTTGRADTSRGWRLPHVHHTVKALEWYDGLEAEISAMWKTYTQDAWRVECRPLRTPLGAIAYLVLHHHKREQGPPAGTKYTKRLRPSRGYMNKPIADYRQEAREVLRDERVAAGLVAVLNVPDEVLSVALDELLAERMEGAREQARYDRPKLVHVREQKRVDKRTGEITWEFFGVLGASGDGRSREAL